MAIDTTEQVISSERQFLKDSISRVFSGAVELVSGNGVRVKVAYRDKNGFLTIVPTKTQNVGQAKPTEMVLDYPEKEYAMSDVLMEWGDQVGEIEEGAEVTNGIREKTVRELFTGIYRGIGKKVRNFRYSWNVKEDIINTTRFVIEGQRKGGRWIEDWYCERVPTKQSMKLPMSGAIKVS